MAGESNSNLLFLGGILSKTVGDLFRISKNRKITEKTPFDDEPVYIQEYIHRKQQSLETLQLLHHARKELISDVLMQRRYTMKVFFQYENNHRILSLEFNRYFTEWINAQIKTAFFTSPEVGVGMVHCLIPIIKKHLHIQTEDIKNIDTALPELFEAKIDTLKTFMKVEDISEQQFNQLDFTIERENALFNRLMKSFNLDAPKGG